ncbi:sulfatase [Haloferula rosea]|uniref:Sulfatase n=1 Tax=Haloferula rosea TaxID=490093 RepID=A0A934VCM4_9BACT|nr:sulfatase [Haloferula rosea]MBK1828603.1 sulfatase [Haloferula rosea]
MKDFSSAFFGLALAAAMVPLSASARKPNVVFFLCDDYGIMDVGIEGSTFYETPRIDDLARKGMRFTEGYATCQVCSPSRASIMLGTYPARNGITNWIGAAVGARQAKAKRQPIMPPDYVRALPKDETTLAEAFKEGGYKTFFAGKWHLGGEGSWPEDHGFDINKGGWSVGSPGGGFFAPWKNPRLQSGPDGESLTLRLGRETAKFIKESGDEPFFAYLSFYAVHGPLQTTEALWEKYRAKAAKQAAPKERFKIDRTLPVRQVQDHPVYAGMVETMDTAVGLVMDALEEAGVAEHTIVCFTSDNGGVVSGDAYATSQFPYRGGKGRQWEGGIREPYYIIAPGVTRPGSTTEVPATGTDFYPTLLELAGLPLRPEQHVDGVSLVPVLKGGKIDERALFWHYPHFGNQGGEPSSIIRKGDWKLIHYWADGRRELYQLSEDQGETEDLAAKYPERVQSMGAELEGFLKESGAKTPKPWAGYQPEMAEQNRKVALRVMEQQERSQSQMLEEGWKPNPDWWSSSKGTP